MYEFETYVINVEQDSATVAGIDNVVITQELIAAEILKLVENEKECDAKVGEEESYDEKILIIDIGGGTSNVFTINVT